MQAQMPILLDHRGEPILSRSQEEKVHRNAEVLRLRREITKLRNNIEARFDLAQTVDKNFRHWQNADYLDPHASAILAVRRQLRIRSRYEIIENNPYLKGCALTLCNDFVGSGPKLAITEPGWDVKARQKIEYEFGRWWEACQMTNKLWRLRMAKLVDGEGFGFAVSAFRRRLEYRDMPVELDFQIIETDRVSSPIVLPLALPTYMPLKGGKSKFMEADGVRWDLQENPIEYNLLPYHPGNMLFPPMGPIENWIDADNVLHWFRQDRGWLRGIPELTTSLPLCALLRRYTLAVVQAAEIGAMISAVIESEAPPTALANMPTEDDPFDIFPAEPGMIMRMPWGYQMKQLDQKQPIQVYDMYISTLLREICRPINMPYNLAAGTSKESNMASAIVDAHIYRGSQTSERGHAERAIVNAAFCLWYLEASLIEGYLPSHTNRSTFPSRAWRWDRVGLDHTDPEKVMNALATAHEKGFLTDKDIQEQYFNRDVEDWRVEIEESKKFRDKIDLPIVEQKPEPAAPSGKTKPKPAKAGSNGHSRIAEPEFVAELIERLCPGYEP